MLKFLKQPYPFDIFWKSNLKKNALIGLFVASFLIVFQPFGTNNWHDEYKTIKLAGYGIIAFLVPCLIFAIQLGLQQPEIIEERWTVGKEIILMLFVISGVALGNMLYSNTLDLSNFSISKFIYFFFIVLIIGIFPIGVGILLRFNHFQRLNQKEAAVLAQNVQEYQQQNPDSTLHSDSTSNEITLLAENEKDAISLNINDLLYIESADNYANIIFWKNEKIQKELLRGALKRFENQLENYGFVMRCHRSFIVNLRHVENINGNAQGYRISLKNYNQVLPVARSYGADILAKLN
jgi:hypothetical protein